MRYAVRVREALEDAVKKRPNVNYIPVHACFQENYLQSKGVKFLCESLLHNKIQIDSLKLYKNKLNDAGTWLLILRFTRTFSLMFLSLRFSKRLIAQMNIKHWEPNTQQKEALNRIESLIFKK